MCYSEGQLQEYIDGQLSQTQKESITRHINECQRCRLKMEQLESNEELIILARETIKNKIKNTDGIDVDRAWMKMQSLGVQRNIPVNGGRKIIMNYKKIAVVAVLALCTATTLSLGPVRAAASDFLKIFRVDKIQTIQIDPRDISSMQEIFSEKGGSVDVRNFGQVESTGSPQSISISLEEARKAFDFTVKLPTFLPAGYSDAVYERTGGSSVKLTLDADNINNMIKSLGGEVLLPKEVDGKTIVINAPEVFTATYTNGSGGRVTVMESASPSIDVPEGVEAETLRSALLAVPALPENLRSQLAAVDDWQHTMLIPSVNGSSQEIKVNGSDAVYIDMASAVSNSKHDANPHTFKDAGQPKNALIMQQDGVIIGIAGSDLDLPQSVKIASSLK